MQVYEGYFEEGRFFAIGQTVRIPGRRRIFITILDEPAKSSKEQDDKMFWAEFDCMIEKSADENELLRDEVFARNSFSREFITFSNEEV